MNRSSPKGNPLRYSDPVLMVWISFTALNTYPSGHVLGGRGPHLQRERIRLAIGNGQPIEVAVQLSGDAAERKGTREFFQVDLLQILYCI